MTQHSTRAASPLPSNSWRGRLLKRSWPVWLVLVAALLLAVPFLFHAGSTVHAADNEITGVTLTSLNPGELAITWDAPSREPDDYRVTWKKSTANWPSYKNENTALGGNAFPTGTSHTVTGLEEGTDYSVRVRARYHDAGGNITESGPWSDPPVELTIAALPDKPTGLSASPSHDSVLLAWTDPGDSSITGYQVLRGPDAANLAVLANDTGSAASSYNDDTVAAETTYVYAIRARNVHGLSPQSDAVPAVTTAAPAPPAKPTGLSTSPSHNNVDLSWTDPNDDSITSYQVLRGPDADNLTVLVDNTGKTNLSYTDSTVAAETTYAYAIRAKNADGLSPQSDTISVMTPGAPPAKPTGLSTNPSHDSLVLSWTDPNDDTITSYQVLRGPDADNLAVLTDDTGDANTSYTDSMVTAETTYAYAIRAKNAHGLGTQSDTATANTPAAPEETPIAEQLPSANFTLDGQALDTSGTCSEDDIGSVSDACTINITTKSPVFAVHGTVDSDDRIGIRTGRDITAALAASEVAGESELRGTDQTVTLALPEGRSLLRVWEDENGDPGGEQARFFRINVLPHWEWDGQLLSKDSACQSTTDLALADITDSDCIVTQSTKTGSLRFHNVTREQFNVYVSVNGNEIINEPDAAALGGPFTVELQSGDNVVRVKLASKGNTHGAESYSSNAFYYKIKTPTPPAKPRITGQGARHSTAFLTWADPGDDSITGYQILRGEDADTLTVLTNDTGSTSTSYTDETVEPETQYFYAIRARNAGGLGPQSDTVSTTTQAAPPELLSEMSIAGVEFTLDGQTLDTASTCNESDVTAIVAGCTINIETKSPVFAVDGTVDSDDRLSIKTGRDKAAVDTASNIADASDLRGAGQTVTLTLPEGRSLLRLWGDQDGNPGGGEEHFFRVNVVPYWEWNGDQLSKDSACRAATAPAAAAITDDDCILTQAGNTASIRFHNVIKDQYNVYVDVKGERVISEPGTTTLAASFTVSLPDGDNVIRIRLASKGAVAETYGSNSYYYKITPTDTMVSNLGQTSTTTATAISTATFTNTTTALAAMFTTGNAPDGYKVSAVRMLVAASTDASPQTSIYTDNSGEPGTSLKMLTTPATLPISAEEVEFDADEYLLQSNTSYWIVIEETFEGSATYLTQTASSDEDAGTVPGWQIGNTGMFRTTGAWMDPPDSHVTKFSIKGRSGTESKDATLSNLQVFDSEPNLATLTPAFDPDITEYTAVVANEHASLELDAHVNDNSATVEFLDENDVAISIDNTVPPNISYILPNIEAGDNVFKVKVTAEDGTTMKTYEVTVTRVDFLVSNIGQSTGGYDRLFSHPVQRDRTGRASQFTTGSNPGGYQVSAVRLDMGIVTGTTPRVSIYSDSSGRPGTSRKVLTNPANLPSVTQTEFEANTVRIEERDFGADNFRLDAGTKYWVVIERESGSGIFIYNYTGASAEDAGTAPGWSIGDGGFDRFDTQTWSNAESHNLPIQLAIKGEPAPIAVPDPPASLSTSAGDTEVDLAWTPPDSDGGAPITKYQYRVSADSGNNWNPDWIDVPDSDSDSDLADEHSVTVTGLVNGTLYTFQVRAVNSVGDGIEAKATATPSTDATLSDLQLYDSTSPLISLNPTFSSSVTQYTATIANEHTDGELHAQVNDPNATVEFLDKDDITIPTEGVSGAISHILPNFEVGEHVFKVKVTAEDGTTTKTYTVTVTVTRQEAPNSPATGKPSISGMLGAGHTLTASTSNIRDDDGLSNRAFTFQWVRVDGATENNISGADQLVYTLTVNDVGFRVKIVVRFLDDRGELETVESMANPASGSIQAPATGS